MTLYKRCPKCVEGDMRDGVDVDGAYLVCVQCGFVRDIPLNLWQVVLNDATS